MFDRRTILAGVAALAFMSYASGVSAGAPPPPPSEGITGASVEGSSVVEFNKVIDWMSERANDIGGNGPGSFSNGTSGVVHVQQNNGSATGLENGTAIQGGLNSHLGPVESSATLDLQTYENKSIVNGFDDIAKDFDDRLNAIGNDSFGGFDGIANVQQNNGDVNQIGISTSILASDGQQVGDGEHVAEVIGLTYSQTGKGAEAKDPDWQEMGVFDDAILDQDSDVLNSISNAFNESSGIFQVQQNNGNGNAIGSATAVLSTNDFQGTLSGGLDVAGTVGLPDINQGEEFFNLGNAIVDVNVNRENVIESAFTDSSGLATVQQNNGHSNFMGAAFSLVVGVNGPALTDGLTDATLSTAVTNNAVQTEQGNYYNNGMIAAFNGFVGGVQVQQNNGNANALASGMHVSVQGLDTNPVPPLPFIGNGPPPDAI